MKLALEKMLLNLKMISWKFIIPLSVVIALSLVALIVSIVQFSNVVAIVICSLTLLGFLGLFIGLYTYNWFKYFKRIKYKVSDLYIIPNNKYKYDAKKNADKIIFTIQNLISFGANICGVHGFLVFQRK